MRDVVEGIRSACGSPRRSEVRAGGARQATREARTALDEEIEQLAARSRNRGLPGEGPGRRRPEDRASGCFELEAKARGSALARVTGVNGRRRRRPRSGRVGNRRRQLPPGRSRSPTRVAGSCRVHSRRNGRPHDGDLTPACSPGRGPETALLGVAGGRRALLTMSVLRVPEGEPCGYPDLPWSRRRSEVRRVEYRGRGGRAEVAQRPLLRSRRRSRGHRRSRGTRGDETYVAVGSASTCRGPPSRCRRTCDHPGGAGRGVPVVGRRIPPGSSVSPATGISGPAREARIVEAGSALAPHHPGTRSG